MSTKKNFVVKTGITAAGDITAPNFRGVADSAAAVPFSGVSGKPTTLAGFGITDGVAANSPVFNGTVATTGGFQTSSGSGYSYAYNDVNLNNYVIRTGPSSAYKYTTIDPSGNFTAPGTVAANYFSGNGGGISNVYASNTSGIGGATGNSYNWSASQSFLSGTNTAYGGPAGNLWAYSNNGGGAAMCFHRGGSYAINMGLDSDNVFRIGGWSAAANLLQMDMSGNLTMAGNVGAYSDRRLKHNIQPIQDALARLLRLNGVTFVRNDTMLPGRGLIAQDVQAEYPELTQISDASTGMLSVAYANFAGDFVEALRQVDARQNQQDLRMAAIEARLDALTPQ